LVSNVHSRTYHEDGNASAYQDKGQRHADHINPSKRLEDALPLNTGIGLTEHKKCAANVDAHYAWNERPPKEISNGVQHRVEQVQKQRWQRKNENHKLYKKRHTVS